ncbi:MAG: TonB family protein [Candidatus Manganitrophus sp.]|nr:MAG: TonB family protein [Candidatus Manganitrophus sp.]
MGGSMSAVRWNSDWVSGSGAILRRAEGLSKMMVLSLVLHVAFFSFALYGRSFLGFSPSAFQSYQVTLVPPSSAPPMASIAPAPRATVPAAPVSRPPSPPVAPPAEASKPLSSKGVPPVKEDPERLQDWWKKKAGSIKIPTVQKPKNDPAPPAPAQTVKRPMATPAPVETNPATPQGETAAPPQPVAPSTSAPSAAPSQEASNPSLIATGSASLNTSLFKYPYYLKSLENKISGQWSPPPVLLDERIVGAVVQFNVTRRGSIESVEIEKSSGNSQFDQAALRAVYNANPLPPLPEGLSEDPLKVHFSFTLQKGS